MHEKDMLFFHREVPPPGFGPGPFMLFRGGGPGFGFGHRRRRMRRGDVRAAILLLLEEEPRNGYQVMQELEQRSGGAWRPSPGSVYPALQLLADEGLIRGESREGGTVYELTEAGRAHLDEHRERFGEPWAQAGAAVPEDVRELMRLAMQVGIAARQVTQAGGEEQRKAAAELLAETRRRLYGILAGE
ncbi:MAG TPA: PadR family transcriptional regulator [Gaiellaceae bacterium]|nr:PadR family transcriptional regulator [Gaiellaceae bacterium]